MNGETLAVAISVGQLTTGTEPAAQPDVVVAGGAAALLAASGASPRPGVCTRRAAPRLWPASPPRSGCGTPP
ncbi:MAG: hypothetical protein ACRDZN_07575 [Acidimicrobiales bacterium]